MIGNYKFAKQAGWLAIVCGSFQIIYGVLAIFFPFSPDIYYGWDEALWIVASLGWACAIIGILGLDAGKPNWLAWSGGIVAIISVPLRIAASIFFIVGSSWDPLPLILLNILLLLGGTFALGIAILRGSKINGWQAWTPMIVVIFGLIVTALFSVNLFIHHVLLGLWGLTWMLVGYVVVLYTTDHEVPSNLATS